MNLEDFQTERFKKGAVMSEKKVLFYLYTSVITNLPNR